MMKEVDTYDILAEHLEFPGSARLRALMEEMMTLQQAQIAVALPGSSQEVAKKLGLSVDTVESELDALFRKGVVFTRDFEKPGVYRFDADDLKA